MFWPPWTPEHCHNVDCMDLENETADGNALPRVSGRGEPTLVIPVA